MSMVYLMCNETNYVSGGKEMELELSEEQKQYLKTKIKNPIGFYAFIGMVSNQSVELNKSHEELLKINIDFAIACEKIAFGKETNTEEIVEF